MSRTMRAAWGSLVVAFLALGLKFAAWWVTGSVALYSDALETIINVVTASAALIAIRISNRPADADHPYGHQKVEYFSAVLEGLVVIGAAAAILHEVYNAWSKPVPVEAPFLGMGMAINGAATALNGAWAAYLIRSGRAWRSPAILASGRHVLTDVWTSAGVLAGFALVPVTGWLWLDPALAGLVALNIIWAGFGWSGSRSAPSWTRPSSRRCWTASAGASPPMLMGPWRRMTCAPGLPGTSPSSSST